ncbi:MAG: DUF2244 domain-containing protein [Gammaproteobacteria bacterium]
MTSVTDIDHEHSAPMQFIVRRNQSLSWRGNKLFIYLMAAVSFGIAGMFALQGLWLILPFAGLEILALTLGLYMCSLHCGDQEVITIDNEQVRIEKGRQKPKESWKFDRSWVNLELVSSPLHGHPSKLLIRSKGNETEIGKCLTNDERKSLSASLVKALDISLIRN